MAIELKYADTTEKIIGCAYKISNVLGCGFLEKVYENALAHEIRKLNLKVEQTQLHSSPFLKPAMTWKFLPTTATPWATQVRLFGSLMGFTWAQRIHAVMG